MNPPDSRLPIAWGTRDGEQHGVVARKVTYTYGADITYWRLNDCTLNANGATELAPIGFAGHLI